jgi:hypothetical protein
MLPLNFFLRFPHRNVINALGIQPHPFLSHLSYLFSEGSGASLSQLLEPSGSDSSSLRLPQMVSVIAVHQKLRKAINAKE